MISRRRSRFKSLEQHALDVIRRLTRGEVERYLGAKYIRDNAINLRSIKVRKFTSTEFYRALGNLQKGGFLKSDSDSVFISKRSFSLTEKGRDQDYI